MDATRGRSGTAGATAQTSVALACFGGVWLILAVRGPDDWSGSLASVFYTLLGLAFVLSITGGSTALVHASIRRSIRWFCIGVGVTVPTVIIAFTLMIAAALSHLN